MLKISKTSLMILAVGIMIIASVSLYLAYAQFVSQRDALYKTIDTANTKYGQVNVDKRSLQPQLAQLQQQNADLKSAYDTARGEFPNVTIQSIEYDEELSRLADESAVMVWVLGATDSSQQAEGNFTYVITNFSVEVKGDRTNILDFIHRLATSSYFATADINTVDLKTGGDVATPTPTPGAPEVPAPINYSDILLTITVFRYEGN